MIAALYVQPRGSYYGLPDVDPWDELRDARQYAGPHPVVAHPPCGRWCRYDVFVSKRYPNAPHLAPGADGGTFAAALAAVRRWGGVLEHPAFTKAWKAHGLWRPAPLGGWTPADELGGWTCHVYQWWYGHPAQKGTWLYAVNTALPELRWGTPPRAKFVVGHAANRAKRCALERLSKRQTAATPTEFRDLLIEIAKSAQR